MKNTILLFTCIAAMYLGTAGAADLAIPFGIPQLPDARLAISDAYDSPSGDREEWIARFGTKASRQDIIAFYRNALEEAGFEIYSTADRENSAMIAGKRDDDRITVSFRTQSDWVEADESEFSIKAVYNKQFIWGQTMTIQDLGAIGEIVGAIAVIATLIYLAAQIRQNNELLRSGSRQALVGNDITSLAANLQHTEVIAKYAAGDSLSAEEQLRLSFMFALDLRNREFEYFQYKNGLLDEDTWNSYRQVILINHSSDLGRKWWDAVGRGIVDRKFASEVDELLKGKEPDTTYVRMSTWADNNSSQP